MFYIIGKLNNTEQSFSFKKGELSGDKEALVKTYEENKKDHGRLGLEPSVLENDYIKNEYAAFELIRQFVFDEIINSPRVPCCFLLSRMCNTRCKK